MTKDEKEFLGRGCAVIIMVGTGAILALSVIAGACFLVARVFLR